MSEKLDHSIQEDPQVIEHYINRYGLQVGPSLRAYEVSHQATPREREELREEVLTALGNVIQHPETSFNYSGQQVVRALADLARIDTSFQIAGLIRAEQIMHKD